MMARGGCSQVRARVCAIMMMARVAGVRKEGCAGIRHVERQLMWRVAIAGADGGHQEASLVRINAPNNVKNDDNECVNALSSQSGALFLSSARLQSGRVLPTQAMGPGSRLSE